MEQVTNYLKEWSIAVVCVIIIAVTAANFPANPHYGEMTFGEKIRKLFVGCVGSCIAVICVYEFFKYIHFPEMLALGLGAAAGYIGGETMIRLLLEFIENKLKGR